MTTFALITEGITDQAIIENILDGLTQGQAIINPLQPLRDATDRSRVASNQYSNWELIFEYLSSDEILDAIQTNEFIVIHIDTDQCSHPNFGLSITEQGTIKSIENIINDCITIIKSKLHPNFPSTETNRLLFAIPVLSTECWLISLHDQNHTHTTKTINNCNDRLSKLLSRKRKILKKDYLTYSQLSKDFRKIAKLTATGKRTPCLQIFINQICNQQKFI
jgi:hypothetical protein